MKKLGLVMGWLFVFLGAKAQEDLPRAYEIKTDTAVFQELPGNYWQILEDRGGKLTFGQVQQAAVAGGFHYPATTKVNTSIYTHWFRFVIKNGMDHDAKICFGVNGEESEFYISANNKKWNRYENGLFIPWSKQDGLKMLQIIPFLIKPGQELIVFNRVYTSYRSNFFTNNVKVGFSSTETVTRNYATDGSSYTFGIHNSFFFGLLVFAALFNFFFFLVVRERVYLYFSIYLILLGIGRMYNELYFGPLREYRVFEVYLMSIVWFLTFNFLTFFIRSLLHTKLYLPKWDKFLLTLNIFHFSINSIFICINRFTIESFAFTIPLLIQVTLVASNLLTFFLLFKKSDKIIIVSILPAFLIWGIGYSIAILYQASGYTFILGDLTPQFDSWWALIETICLSWLVIFFSWILLQRFRRLQNQIAQQAFEKQKEKNLLIAQQKIELEQQVKERTAELNQSVINLKDTQNQLIQSAKMASLGELTAGIAHEIQNPLNFVNNFSDVNQEMIGELELELKSGNVDEALAIADDIKQNEQKINHHGKRADAIVKSMLGHSRTSTGEKHPTNINTLVDEFLKLSYHGLRAKDKSFNADMATNFDDDLPKANIVQQDIGRVLLNLFNNAFYAISQKAKTAGSDYKPAVEVSTSAKNGQIEIKVKDNGNGIPENIKDKIMQPFFTTKPTGEGTGLGLSLSYDIITKGHGGSIDMDTREGEFTEFKIRLPL